MSIERKIDKALSLARKGKKKQALLIFQSVLEKYPKNSRAIKAVNLLQKELGDESFLPPKLTTEKILSLYNSKQYSAAKREIDNILSSFSKSSFLWKINGATCLELGLIQEAIKSFYTGLKINPKDFEMNFHLGRANLKNGNLQEAEQNFNDTISLKKNYVDALYNLGIVQRELGNNKSSIATFRKTIDLYPNHFRAINNIGICQQNLGRIDLAIKSFTRAIELNPGYAEAHFNLGNAEFNSGRIEPAISYYKKAIQLSPDSSGYFVNLGIAQRDLGYIELAVKSYNRAIELNPNSFEAHNNLGTVLKKLDQLELAIKSYRKAIELNPNSPEMLTNLGVALEEVGQIHSAICKFKEAIDINPDDAEAHWCLAHSYNLLGNYKDGFAHYEWRFKKRDEPIRPPRDGLQWDGKKSLSGKTVLVYQEQGLGDIIQFCRFIPILEKYGSNVLFYLNKKLHAIISSLKINATLVSDFPPENTVDYEIPLMSLPYFLKTNVQNIPSDVPYLFVEKSKIIKWAKRLEKGTFKIGICWQGSRRKIDVGRSFELSLFKKISKLQNVELISLHKGHGESQIMSSTFKITKFDKDFDGGGDAFMDSASIMMNCDLIITSDTAIAHLAGALGLKVWVGLKFIPDWRWMLGKNSSPWYPTMVLYRQSERGKWDRVFEEFYQDLELLVKN